LPSALEVKDQQPAASAGAHLGGSFGEANGVAFIGRPAGRGPEAGKKAKCQKSGLGCDASCEEHERSLQKGVDISKWRSASAEFVARPRAGRAAIIALEGQFGKRSADLRRGRIFGISAAKRQDGDDRLSHQVNPLLGTRRNGPFVFRESSAGNPGDQPNRPPVLRDLIIVTRNLARQRIWAWDRRW